MFSGYLCDRYFRSPVPLVAVFDALARLGQLDTLFAEVAEKLREEVITPLLSARYVPPPKVDSVLQTPDDVQILACGRADFCKRWGKGICRALICWFAFRVWQLRVSP